MKMENKDMKKDEYRCEKCKEVWGFIPADYEFNEKDYPKTCPLCQMPITQMIKEVYIKDGILEVLRRIWIRL